MIVVIVTNLKSNLVKVIDVTEYNMAQFKYTCEFYSKLFDVKVKRYVNH